MSEMGSHDQKIAMAGIKIHWIHKLWPKERLGVKFAI
jgi:hypothetical protein